MCPYHLKSAFESEFASDCLDGRAFMIYVLDFWLISTISSVEEDSSVIRYRVERVEGYSFIPM